MEFYVTYAIITVIAIALLFLIAKFVIRLVIRLFLSGLVILALLLAAAFGWWNGWFDTSAPQKPRPQRGLRRSSSCY